jgi:hypothetical protein
MSLSLYLFLHASVFFITNLSLFSDSFQLIYMVTEINKKISPILDFNSPKLLSSLPPFCHYQTSYKNTMPTNFTSSVPTRHLIHYSKTFLLPSYYWFYFHKIQQWYSVSQIQWPVLNFWSFLVSWQYLTLLVHFLYP